MTAGGLMEVPKDSCLMSGLESEVWKLRHCPRRDTLAVYRTVDPFSEVN
jgi:hypothetical protein